MGWFHALLAEQGETPKIVWHMCPKSDWDDKKSVYYPKAYDEEKFTRAQHEPQRLVETANCFYSKSDEKEWICLEINTTGLAVFGIEIKMELSETDPELKCPHIFGGLPRETVVKVYPILRGENGEFLFVQGLTDVCSGDNH